MLPSWHLFQMGIHDNFDIGQQILEQHNHFNKNIPSMSEFMWKYWEQPYSQPHYHTISPDHVSRAIPVYDHQSSLDTSRARAGYDTHTSKYLYIAVPSPYASRAWYSQPRELHTLHLVPVARLLNLQFSHYVYRADISTKLGM